MARTLTDFGFDLDLFQATCSGCEMRIRLSPAGFLLNDVRNGAWVVMRSDGQKPDMPIVDSVEIRYRYVRTIEQVFETLAIFSADLDDRAVQLAKLDAAILHDVKATSLTFRRCVVRELRRFLEFDVADRLDPILWDAAAVEELAAQLEPAPMNVWLLEDLDAAVLRRGAQMPALEPDEPDAPDDGTWKPRRWRPSVGHWLLFAFWFMAALRLAQVVFFWN